MRNFVKFLKAYEALDEARNNAFSISEHVQCNFFSGYYGFPNVVQWDTITNIDIGINILLEWFDENFPRTTADAAQCECFSYPAFFDMLKKHPELVVSNEEILQGLLCSLKAKGLYGTGLESFPTIDEFITKEMMLKVAKAAEAVKLLRKVKDPKSKKKIRPILEDLKARRPRTREAFFASQRLYLNWEDDEIIRQVRACLKDA